MPGQEHGEAHPRRTRIDGAHWMRDRLEERYPQADRVILVADNLNTHTLGALQCLARRIPDLETLRTELAT